MIIEEYDETDVLQYNSKLDICCVIRVESLRYIYLVKKSLIKQLNDDLLQDANNLDESDYLISQALKQISPLHLMIEESYGELINYKDIPESRKHIELYRFLENFNLWQRRYIQKIVSSFNNMTCTYLIGF